MASGQCEGEEGFGHVHFDSSYRRGATPFSALLTAQVRQPGRASTLLVAYLLLNILDDLRSSGGVMVWTLD